MCKDIGSGAAAARQVGNVFHDRGFADVFLRYLMQTGGRMHMTMNRLQCDMQLQGCQLGHMLPEQPKTMWPLAEDVVRSPDVSAWKSALCDGLRSADGFHVLCVDGTMKIAMGVRRRDAGTPLTPGGSQQDRADRNMCVLTTRTLQGAVLDLAVVPSECKPKVVVSALENAVLPDDRVRVHWAVVDNASPALHAALSRSFPPLRGRRAGHVPSSDEVRGRGLASRFSRVQDAPSACQQVQRVLRRSARTWTPRTPFEVNSNLITKPQNIRT